jgi:aspartyl aminopeptidase
MGSLATIPTMTTDGKDTARALAKFIDESPSPFHACASAAARLEGFTRLAEADAWSLSPGGYYVIRGGSLVAWIVPPGLSPWSGFRVVGAHTDSPNLRVKPRPDAGSVGFRQLGVEVYGGALLNSWLNRDLGLSGRVWVRSEGGASESGRDERLFRIDRPLLCVPQLAIHLNRELRTEGLKLNAQRHMSPIWALDDDTEAGFLTLLAAELDVDPDAILAWDAMCHDTTPSALLGADEEFLAAGRLDNLCSCFCAIDSLAALTSEETPARLAQVPVVTLFDHEEVGSKSATGASGPLLGDIFERIVQSLGGGREDYHRAIAASMCVSADMAHATHPNYVAKHEPEHHVAINGGPVIKVNANQHYATEGETEAIFQQACERADVPFQKWVMRTDLACGSTIGPATAAALGIKTVDVGNPQLSMHSAREMCGSLDPGFLTRAFAELWR